MDNKFNFDLFDHVFKQLNPNIICLQEVDRFTNRNNKRDLVDIFSRMTGFPGIFSKSIFTDDGEYGNMILTPFQIVNNHTITLAHPLQYEDRTAQFLMLKIKGNHLISIINTHLDNHESTDFKTKQLINLSQRLNDSDHPAFICGDFNLEFKDLPWENDSNWNASDRNLLPTFPSYFPTKKIDYIIYKSHSNVTLLNTIILPEEKASDHCPFFAEFDI